MRLKGGGMEEPLPVPKYPPLFKAYPPPKGEGRSFQLTFSSSLQVGFKSATTTLARPLNAHLWTTRIGTPRHPGRASGRYPKDPLGAWGIIFLILYLDFYGE